MVKLNHERPLLKYIDNLNRERKLESSKYKFDEEFPYESNSADEDFWKQMLQIGLSDREWELFFELLTHGANYFETQSELLALMLEKGKGKQRTNLKKKSEQIYAALLVLGEELLATELAAQINGRKNGLGNLFDLMKIRLQSDNAVELWDLINNSVMREVFHKFEAGYNESENQVG